MLVRVKTSVQQGAAVQTSSLSLSLSLAEPEALIKVRSVLPVIYNSALQQQSVPSHHQATNHRHEEFHKFYLQKTRSDQLDNILGDLPIISETLGSFGMQQSVSAVQL